MTTIPIKYQAVMTILLSIAILVSWVNGVESSDHYSTYPTTNMGKKWRIGYYEGGPYINYPANLKAIATGLAGLVWMEEPPAIDLNNATDAKKVWEALSKTKSNYLHFVREAFSSSNWDKDLRAKNREMAINRLNSGELDLMIAMGTWAGQDLANNSHAVPIMVVSSSDPIRSGIIKSATKSGFKHVHAKCDPQRYIRQTQLFHNIVGFKRLGVVYENSIEGKSYAAIADIELVAAQRGFQLVACEAPWSGISQHDSTQNLIACHEKLAPQIDALFLTVHVGVASHRMDEILAPLNQHKIPTWSQRGPQEVSHGVLLSISRKGFGPVGMYHAKIMAKIFNGANPEDLDQRFKDPGQIAINLKTASDIGFKPPKGLMKVADEIYK